MALLAINWRPDPKQLRTFGALSVVAFGVLGFRVSSAWFYPLAAACLVATLFAPRALRPLYVALLALTAPIGFVVSHGVMLALFFGVFTPLGLLMRAFGWDAMNRRFDRGATTYWARRPPVDDVKRYFHQY